MISCRRNFNFQPKENHMTRIVKPAKPENKKQGIGSDLERAVKNFDPPKPATPTVIDGVNGETWESRLARQGKNPKA
jgi:hypothetical protein